MEWQSLSGRPFTLYEQEGSVAAAALAHSRLGQAVGLDWRCHVASDR